PALVLLTLVVVGAVRTQGVLARQLQATRRLGRAVRGKVIKPVPAGLASSAARAGLAGQVDLIDSIEPCSFTWGFARPRVAVSRGLLDTVDASELDAVLVHERYHVVNFDPVKVLLTRVLPPSFFYLPGLEELHERYLASRELAADRRAVEAHGRKPLAGALF